MEENNKSDNEVPESIERLKFINEMNQSFDFTEETIIKIGKADYKLEKDSSDPGLDKLWFINLKEEDKKKHYNKSKLYIISSEEVSKKINQGLDGIPKHQYVDTYLLNDLIFIGDLKLENIDLDEGYKLNTKKNCQVYSGPLL